MIAFGLLLLALSPLRIDSAADYSRRHGGEVLVIREAGRTVHDEQSMAARRGERYACLSITKSLVGTLFLAARNDGLLDLDERASDTLTEWRKKPAKRDIRIRDLLNLQAGLSPGYHCLYRKKIANKAKEAVALGMTGEPGGQFAYGPADFEVLEELLARKLKARGVSPLSYFQRRLFNYIGASIEGWRLDLSGNPYFSTGARLSVPQFLRFGDIVLNAGRPGLTRWFCADLGAIYDPRAGLPVYALGFWRNLSRGNEINVEREIGERTELSFWRDACLSRSAPRDMVAMIGSYGQRLYVVPSRKLVVLRLGQSRHFDDAAFLRELFGPAR
ncbi:MAG TPA: serine hydrolase domain-containing protein [Chthoniobacterales bacterium]